MSEPASERVSLAEIATLAEAIRRMLRKYNDTADPKYLGMVNGFADTIKSLARQLGMQVAEGVHTNPRHRRNPPLLLYGNPPTMEPGPAGTVRTVEVALHPAMSRNVHAIQYTHVSDGEDYNHDFEGDAQMFPVTTMHGKRLRGVLLLHGDGKPLWKDFD